MSRDMKVYNLALKHCKGVELLDRKLLCSRYIGEIEKIIEEESAK